MEMHGISVMNHPHHVWFITIDFMDFHFLLGLLDFQQVYSGKVDADSHTMTFVE